MHRIPPPTGDIGPVPQSLMAFDSTDLPINKAAREHCPGNANATCKGCLTSAAHSTVELVRIPGGGATLQIHSVSASCASRTDGGDVWVERVFGKLSSYRVVANDLGTGSYTVELPPPDEQHLKLHVHLWWTTSLGRLEGGWDILRTTPLELCAQPAAVAASSSLIDSRCTQRTSADTCSSGEVQCAAQAIGSTDGANDGRSRQIRMPVPGVVEFARLPSSRRAQTVKQCAAGAPGRWLSVACIRAGNHSMGHIRCDAAAETEINEDDMWRDSPLARARRVSRLQWHRFGCQERTCACSGEELLKLLGPRRLLLMGDSTSRGTFLDLCVMLGPKIAAGSAGCQRLNPATFERPDGAALRRGDRPQLPHGKQIMFAAIFGDHEYRAGVGIDNLLSSRGTAAAWEYALSSAGPMTVVMGSGMHDVSIRSIKASPSNDSIAKYRRNICRLAGFVERVRGRNPNVSFVWRTTIHQLLTSEHTGLGFAGTSGAPWAPSTQSDQPACIARGWVAGTFPPLFRELNAHATRVFSVCRRDQTK